MPSPPQRRQTIVFVRHGIAAHNVHDVHGQRPDLHNPRYFDPPLIGRGKMGAIEAGEAIETWWKTTQVGETIELIVCSPLTRCLQTALVAFLPGGEYQEPRRIMAIESVREAYGMHYPDRRRSISLLKKHWPMIDFDPTMTDEDQAWQPDHRETMTDIERRVDESLAWLVQRTESNIVVVSHGVWIECCLQRYCRRILEGGRRVYNCDAFSCEAVSENGRLVRLDHAKQIHGHHIR